MGTFFPILTFFLWGVFDQKRGGKLFTLFSSINVLLHFCASHQLTLQAALLFDTFPL